MAKKSIAQAAAAPTTLSIALTLLRPSPRNVRASEPTIISTLAESIARVGLLQSLVVVPAADGQHYEVAAGARRLAALQKLADARRIRSTYEVPCLVVPDALATTASILENVERQAMHPADQLGAFKRLVEDGRSIEDIAADFGVTPLVVRRRLKLAVVSPRLMQAYRAGEASLDQLTALSLSDDHSTQDTAFFEAAGWERDASSLRRRVLGAAVHAGQDRLARFVGIEAYKAAGGSIRLDLFGDEADPGYIDDVGMLERLAQDKLEAAAQKVRAEGHPWVDIRPRMRRYQIHHEYRAARRVSRQPDAKTQQRLSAIGTRMMEIDVLLEKADEHSDEHSEERDQELSEEAERLSSEAQRLEDMLQDIDPSHLPFAGAVLLVGDDGEAVIERGWLRTEESAQWSRTGAEDENAGPAAGCPETAAKRQPSLSSSLTERLTTHQTAALRAELCEAPELAPRALVHKLALDVLAEDRYLRTTSLKIQARAEGPAPRLGEEITASPAGKFLQAAQERWRQTLPPDSALWFDALGEWPLDQLLSLLAFLVAAMVDVVRSDEGRAGDDALVSASGLDLRKWWSPTADAFFNHVPKSQSLAVAQVLSPESVPGLSKLRKEALAAEVARLAQTAQWLPPIFGGTAR